MLGFNFFPFILHKKLLYIRMMKKNPFVFILSIFTISAFGQNEKDLIKWRNPQLSGIEVVGGQAWPKEVANFYDRLPKRAQSTVRKEVWNLSNNSAGLTINFKTNAKAITVRYVVKKKNYAMNHFPATGVSGVDLYSKNEDGSWAWANGKSSFNDTITYEFKNLDLDTRNYPKGRDYHLYLPTYNTLAWLEIGVNQNESFSFTEQKNLKPIVIYGTSIAQGGCASRPGMAWTAILERSLNTPVINLGFSGNGRLEKEVVELVGEIDAKIFVLDCLPNMSGADGVETKIIDAVTYLRKNHPQTPILLTDHSGFIENRLDATKRRALIKLNMQGVKAYNTLIAYGVTNLYRLPADKINIGTDGTVDGTHPTDLGMYRYATAYEQCILEILKERK